MWHESFTLWGELCRCISPGSVKLGSFTAYIPVAPAEEDELDDDVLPETAAEASAAKAGTGASRNQSGNTQPNNQDDEMAAERLSEFREGGALTRGAGGGGHRLGGAGGGTTPLPDIVTADAGMEDTGADRGAATGAGTIPLAEMCLFRRVVLYRAVFLSGRQLLGVACSHTTSCKQHCQRC